MTTTCPHRKAPRMRIPMALLSYGTCASAACIIIVLSVIGCASASSGDRSVDFRQCIEECIAGTCREERQDGIPIPFRLLRWTCVDECRYDCMWRCTDDDVVLSRPVRQYYGKWPFKRFLGMQEPVSVLFSVFNGAMHVRGLIRFLRDSPRRDSMRLIWIGYAVASVNLWLWSAVYHARDFLWTERLDYFAGTIAIMYSLHAAVIRTLGVTRTPARAAILVAFAYWAVRHIQYQISLGDRFDYGYNMTVGLAAAFAHAVLWFGWMAYAYFARKKRYVAMGAYALCGVAAAMVFEIFDFPPIAWAVDAHALWHIGTVPFILPWYAFLAEDARDRTASVVLIPRTKAK